MASGPSPVGRPALAGLQRMVSVGKAQALRGSEKLASLVMGGIG